ncbi:MAG: hypothetical protein C0467_31860 [Planctomycetaceae bacterium]|nr:hypothetical protein [Planctomycetaceae bacterium]
MVRQATAIKTDAIALMGEFLHGAEKNRGASAGGEKEGSRGSYREPRDTTPTLAEVGITKKESMNAQTIAALKSSEPEHNLRQFCRRL